jgi:hypothetical protein
MQVFAVTAVIFCNREKLNWSKCFLFVKLFDNKRTIERHALVGHLTLGPELINIAVL